MARLRIVAVSVLLALAVAAGTPVQADPIPLPVGEAGMSVTLDAADKFREGSPYSVSGHVYGVLAVPLVLEVSRGLQNQTVDILVDGARRASTTTNNEGHYRVDLSLTGEPATHTIQAVVNRGTPAEVRSRTQTTTIDQVFTSMRLTPSSTSLDVGASTQLRAFALDGDGREQDVTSRAAWSTSDANVATVSGGLVRAVSPGAASMTATFADLAAGSSVTVVDNGRG